MVRKISQILDKLSEFLAHRKGLLPTIGIVLVLFNYILNYFPELGWVVQSDLFLHIGIVLAIFGIMIAWAL